MMGFKQSLILFRLSWSNDCGMGWTESGAVPASDCTDPNTPGSLNYGLEKNLRMSEECR
jgi:hypothetical protein